MQIKKFEAPTMQEALDTIKKDLGPDAIILRTRKNRGGLGLFSKESVEVTVAISDRFPNKKRNPQTSERVELSQSHTKDSQVAQSRYIDIQDTQREIDLAGTVAMLERSDLMRPEFQELFEQLVINGVDRRLSFGLIKKAAFQLGPEIPMSLDRLIDQVAHEIIATTQVVSPWAGVHSREDDRSSPAVVAMIGPTGVGKTTTIAKIASDASLRRKLKVGLVNLDSYKVSSFDQLGTYARILNLPFRSVVSVDDLKVALKDFQGMDLILVDTTGRSPRDAELLREMQETLQLVPGVHSNLVVSATTRDSELRDVMTRFSIFEPHGVIVSKLDEAMLYGCIYNISQKSKLPLVCFTTGQNVPEDIEEATAERVVALILDL